MSTGGIANVLHACKSSPWLSSSSSLRPHSEMGRFMDKRYRNLLLSAQHYSLPN